MKYLLILNPNAGSSHNFLKNIFDHFKGHLLEIKNTTAPKDATKYAKAAKGKYDVVIAAGGDGTINEVVNGLAGSKKTKLGILPLGTENVLAKELHVPLKPEEAIKRIIKGKSKKFDLGLANKRYFTMVAGIGFDAQVAADVPSDLKKLLGSYAYHLTAIRTFFTFIPSEMEIKLDNQKMLRKGYMVVVGNIKRYGWILELTKHAKAQDGYLDVCIFKNKDVFNTMKYLVSATTTKNIPDLPNVEYFKVKQLTVKSKKPVLAHVDCEVLGKTPIKIKVLPKALEIIY